jgi:aspartate 1-decarboxylase
MFKRMLCSKLRDIKITGTYLEYEGSITLDEDYMDQAEFVEYEEVQVLNTENGNRFSTYVIKGARGSGCVELNGPAARLGLKGDRIMVLSYAILTPEEVKNHVPRVVSGRK